MTTSDISTSVKEENTSETFITSTIENEITDSTELSQTSTTFIYNLSFSTDYSITTTDPTGSSTTSLSTTILSIEPTEINTLTTKESTAAITEVSTHQPIIISGTYYDTKQSTSELTFTGYLINYNLFILIVYLFN